MGNDIIDEIDLGVGYWICPNNEVYQKHGVLQTTKWEQVIFEEKIAYHLTTNGILQNGKPYTTKPISMESYKESSL